MHPAFDARAQAFIPAYEVGQIVLLHVAGVQALKLFGQHSLVLTGRLDRDIIDHVHLLREEGVAARQPGHGDGLIQIAVIVPDVRQAVGHRLTRDQLQAVGDVPVGLKPRDKTIAHVDGVRPLGEPGVATNLLQGDDIAQRLVRSLQVGAPVVIADQGVVFGLIAISLVDKGRHLLERRIILRMRNGGDAIAPLDQAGFVLVVLVGIKHVPQGVDSRIAH